MELPSALLRLSRTTHGRNAALLRLHVARLASNSARWSCQYGIVPHPAVMNDSRFPGFDTYKFGQARLKEQ